MKRQLHILIHSLGMPFDGETILTKSLGGSETAAYYQAHGLAALGHDVELWTGAATNAKTRGVTYSSVGNVTPEHPLGERFEQHATHTPHDVLIIQRHPFAFHKKWAAKICIWQLHDLALHRSTGMIYQGLWQANAVTVVSEWHKRQVIEVWGLKESAVHVVPNGVDLALYDADGWLPDRLKATLQLDKFNLLFQSRPERGLENLVRPGGIMDQLKDTRAQLLICGYANTQPAMANAYAAWSAMGRALPNVTDLGALTKVELAAVQRNCDLLVYPSTFEEVSCITAMEAMAAGLPMIASDAGALRETCKDAGVKLVKLVGAEVDIGAFVNGIKSRIASPDSMKRDADKQLSAAKRKSWSIAVDVLDALIQGLVDDSRTPARLSRHAFEHSDIQIAREYLPWTAPMSAYRELALYDFASTDEGYAAHYAKHQGLYYDGPGEKAIGEDVTGSLRFRGVLSLLSQRQDELMGSGGEPPPMRIMDYGCAHGHYLMPLAKMLPQSQFFGVDIAARAIDAAFRWAAKDNVRNVSFVIGQLEAAAEVARPEIIERAMAANDVPGDADREIIDNRFDAIIAAEVLEHVADPAQFINALRSLLKPGGYLIGTTPVGRWEWTGTAAYAQAREHLWHFEKSDLKAMFEGFEHEILYAPAGADKAGGVLGSWVWRLSEDKGLGLIQIPPLEDRVRHVVPRQTLSACLIVKDAERTLRACVESFIDWVDEIVIGVDAKTTDRTAQVIHWLREDYPLKSFIVFDGASAIEDGFDAARNATLDRATSDWILWLDADETVQRPWELWKFLKPSAIDAYGLGQVHYSVDPPKVLTTDFPNRLFRKSTGARFYGLVHEHPEVIVGKSIPNVIVRHETQFLHSGYVNEETRRERYARNMPLLLKDLEKHPDRTLNRFLSLRDMAQSVAFNLERNGGHITQYDAAIAQKVITQYERMLEDKDHVRMLIDGLEYYSLCVRCLGVGFDAEAQFKFQKEPFTDLNASTGIKGHFRTRDVYTQLVNRITEETTRHYESKHL